MRIIISESQLKRIIKEGCSQLYSQDIIDKSKEYWRTWLNNSITIEKISKNYGIDINEVKNNYVPKWLEVINKIEVKFDNIKKDSYAYSQGTIIHINCETDNGKDENPIDTLTHEIQHILFNIMSMNPVKMIKNVSRVSGVKSEGLTNIINAFGLVGYDENKLLKYKSYWEKNGDKEYIYDPDEIMSRMGSIRGKYGIVPGGRIDVKIFKDVFFGVNDNSDMGWIICMWARNGYPEFNKFIGGLDRLAVRKNGNINYNV